MLRCGGTYTATEDPPTWIPELKLSTHHREILATPRMVGDTTIDAGQQLLRKQFGYSSRDLSSFRKNRYL